jgi:hypothetical protein
MQYYECEVENNSLKWKLPAKTDNVLCTFTGHQWNKCEIFHNKNNKYDLILINKNNTKFTLLNVDLCNTKGVTNEHLHGYFMFKCLTDAGDLSEICGISSTRCTAYLSTQYGVRIDKEDNLLEIAIKGYCGYIRIKLTKDQDYVLDCDWCTKWIEFCDKENKNKQELIRQEFLKNFNESNPERRSAWVVSPFIPIILIICLIFITFIYFDIYLHV